MTDPFVGAWLVQVAFSATNAQVPERLRGQLETMLMTFVPGGALVASGPYATTAAGHWHVEDDGSYSYELVELVFDPSTHAVTRVVVPSANVVLDETGRAYTVQRGVTRVTTFDAADGKAGGVYEIVIDAAAADPAERVTGEKIVSGWSAPERLPVAVSGG